MLLDGRKSIKIEFDGFDWDFGNQTKSVRKHDVSVEEAEQIFFNEPIFVLPDLRHSNDEERYIALGKTSAERRLTVVFTLRQKADKTLLRPISARPMHEKERKLYEEAFSQVQK